MEERSVTLEQRKTVLITGTSKGIGKATARYFQRKDWNVVATMRRPRNETELTGLDHVLVNRLDVQDAGSIAAAVEEALSAFGRIDVLVNNAGYGAYGVLEATALESIRRQFDVNVIGMLATTKAVLPHFRARREGIIINVSSIGGKTTFPLGTLYHGSKFAVEGLSEALSFEMAAIGVKVKIVEPGVIKSGSDSFELNNDESLAEYRGIVSKLLAAMGPLGESASEPEVVAEVIYEAATDGTDRLRYTAGPDAERILSHRKAADDATFLEGIRSQFGL